MESCCRRRQESKCNNNNILELCLTNLTWPYSQSRETDERPVVRPILEMPTPSRVEGVEGRMHEQWRFDLTLLNILDIKGRKLAMILNLV